ncbi:MAG: hypothetical protein ACE5KX_08470, partial [Acidimicrobiia bacterium]
MPVGPDDPTDTFDDLFEPFELGDEPPELEDEPPEPAARPRRQAPPPETEEPPRPAMCPSCGTENPPYNRHCEACGARIAQGPLPVAPPPMLRTTPGARALMVLAGVILVVALLALLVNVFRGGDNAPAAEPTVTTAVPAPPLAIEELKPIRVDCSSELPGWPCDALIDEDPTNYWNAINGGEDAEIKFFFTEPVQITEILVHNPTDEEDFLRNFRINGLEIAIDDLGQLTIRN